MFYSKTKSNLFLPNGATPRLPRPTTALVDTTDDRDAPLAECVSTITDVLKASIARKRPNQVSDDGEDSSSGDALAIDGVGEEMSPEQLRLRDR